MPESGPLSFASNKSVTKRQSASCVFSFNLNVVNYIDRDSEAPAELVTHLAMNHPLGILGHPFIR